MQAANPDSSPQAPPAPVAGTPEAGEPPDPRREWPYAAGVFLLLLGLYARTAPRGVALEDDGGFIMAAHFLGIPHPPGYPLYVLLAKLATWWPLGSAAYRVHLFSGLLGAATCVALWWILRSLTRSPALAALGALAFGVSPIFWSQSIIAEVYTLNTLLFFTLFALSMELVRSQRSSLVPALGFVYGLALSNHTPLIVLATPCLVLVLWPARARVARRLLAAALALALGLSPYLWMVVRSWSDVEFSFYGPIRSFDELWHYLAREGYARKSDSPTAGSWDRIQFALFLSREALRQYTPIGALLAAVGFGSQLRSTRPTWSLALLVGFLSGGYALVFLVGSDYELLNRIVWSVFPLIPYGIMAIWLTLGLAWIGERVRERNEAAGRLLPCVAAAALVLVMGVQGFARNDRSSYRFAGDYARAVLESLEPNAILFTAADADAFPLGYANLVEGVRPDVDLYHYEGLLFGTRLFHALDGTRERRHREALRLIRQSDRPVYFVIPRLAGQRWEHLGFVSKLERPLGAGDSRHRVEPSLVALARRMSEERAEHDVWTRLQRDAHLANYATVLVHVLHRDPMAPEAARYREDLEAFSTGFLGAYTRWLAEIEVARLSPEALLELGQAAEAKIDGEESKRNRAGYWLARGRLLASMDRGTEAEQSLRRSLQTHPHPGNEAVLELLRLYARGGEREKYRELRNRVVLPEAREELMRLDRRAGI